MSTSAATHQILDRLSHDGGLRAPGWLSAQHYGQAISADEAMQRVTHPSDPHPIMIRTRDGKATVVRTVADLDALS